MRLIDAEELLPKIINWREALAESFGKDDEYVKCLGEVIEIIEDAPTIEEQKAKWYLRDTTRYGGLPYICPVCKKAFESMHNFCPNCGADMRGDGND